MPRASLGRRAFLGKAAAGAGLAQLAAADTPDPSSSDDPMPASSIDDLDRAMWAVLASKRLGTPVFVRLTVAGDDQDAAIVARVAGLLDLAAAWLGQEVARLHATGALDHGQLCVTATAKEGGCAIVSFTGGKAHGDGLDLLLIGSLGASYRDAGSGSLWDGLPAGGPKPRAATTRAIQQALKTGKPIPVG